MHFSEYARSVCGSHARVRVLRAGRAVPRAAPALPGPAGAGGARHPPRARTLPVQTARATAHAGVDTSFQGTTLNVNK